MGKKIDRFKKHAIGVLWDIEDVPCVGKIASRISDNWHMDLYNELPGMSINPHIEADWDEAKKNYTKYEEEVRRRRKRRKF